MARHFTAASSDYVDLGTSVRGNDLFGIMAAAWVNLDDHTSEHKVVGRWGAGISDQYLLTVGSDGKVTFAILDSGFSGHSATGTTVLTSGTWYHIAGYWDNFTPIGKVLVNGVVEATFNPAVSLNQGVGSSHTYIGRDASGNYMNGVVAEVIIQLVNTHLSSVASYDQAILSMAQGAVGWDAVACIAGSELIRYVPLFGDSPEPDWAGHAAGGTVTGTTVVNHAPVAISLTGTEQYSQHAVV